MEYEYFLYEEQNLGPAAGMTAVLWYPAILLAGALVFSWSPGVLLWLPGSLPSPCSVRGVAPNLRIQ